MRFFGRFLFFFVIFVTWLVLSGHFSKIFITLGLISSFLAVVLFVKLPDIASHDSIKGSSFSYIYWAKLPFYFIWLVKEIMISSLQLALKILKPEFKPNPEFAWVKSKQDNEIGLTTYANSITLTPGTVSVLINGDKRQIKVHAIAKKGMEELASGVMDKRIKNISSIVCSSKKTKKNKKKG